MFLLRHPRPIVSPQGVLRPNRAALGRGLSFLQPFQNGPSRPFVYRGAVANASYHITATTPQLYAGRGSVGLEADGWGGSNAGNTYSLSQVAGTVLMYLTQFVDGGLSGRRWLTQFGPAGDNQHRMEILGADFSFGWIAGGVPRLMQASAAGYYTAGVPFTVAATWNAGGQAAYASGRQWGSAAAGYADTAGNNISIGYLPGFGFEAGRVRPSALHYVLVFDTAFSAGDIAAAEADPWWWVERPPLMRVRRPASAPAAPLRRPFIFRH